MKILLSALLIGTAAFACASTDKAVAGSGTDASQGGAGGTMGERGCDESVCEGKTYMGQSLATCCVNARGCGVIVDGTCTPPILIADRSQEAGASPFGTAETVVLDPTCPDQSITMGTTVTLKGCCDRSGVCGSSTEALAAAFGAPIPAMCVTRKEARGFGQRVEAGADIACDYPSDAGSSADASARD